MKGIHIISTGSAVPECEYDNHKMSLLVDTSDEWITSRTGIKNRYICENEKETCLSLACEAAEKALQQAQEITGLTMEALKERIAIVITGTSTGDYAFPSVACMTAKALGLPKEVLAFDLSAACSGFLYGMEMCRGYLANHEDKLALLIGAEQLSRIIDYTDRGTCILFGDGAGAALIEPADHVYYHQAGCDANIEALNCRSIGFEDNYVHMNGNAVFRFAVKILQQNIDEILEKQGISLEDVDLIIPHQANARILDHVKKKYKGYEDKFCMNLDRYGNTSAASIPILMDELFREGKLTAGMKIICVGFGAGLTWGSAYLEV